MKKTVLVVAAISCSKREPELCLETCRYYDAGYCMLFPGILTRDYDRSDQPFRAKACLIAEKKYLPNGGMHNV